MEPDESFAIRLSSPVNAELALAEARGTIIDDDMLPVLTVADASAPESSAELEFTVSLADAARSEVTAGYSTSDGTAVTGDDYEGVSGTLTLSPGTVHVTVPVPILNDRLDEPDETLTLSLHPTDDARPRQGVGYGHHRRRR